jgi:hypothetical protein
MAASVHLHVCPTGQSDRAFDNKFARPRLRNRNLLYPQVSGAVEPHREHARHEWMEALLRVLNWRLAIFVVSYWF